MDIPNLDSLGDLAKQMQDAYGDGLDAMSGVTDEVAEDMTPTHEIVVDIKLDAKVEDKEYSVESEITFEIDLDSILNAQTGNLAKALEGLDVDLGDDKDAVMEQLGQPRAIGVVKKINTKNLKISNQDGEVKTDLNRKGTILATLKDNNLLFNFESTLSYPENTDVYVAIPSMEKMQEEIVVSVEELTKTVDFKWTEKDKDNLKVEGSLKISKS